MVLRAEINKQAIVGQKVAKKKGPKKPPVDQKYNFGSSKTLSLQYESIINSQSIYLSLQKGLQILSDTIDAIHNHYKDLAKLDQVKSQEEEKLLAKKKKEELRDLVVQLRMLVNSGVLSKAQLSSILDSIESAVGTIKSLDAQTIAENLNDLSKLMNEIKQLIPKAQNLFGPLISIEV